MINLSEGHRIPGGRTAALVTGISFQGDGPCPAGGCVVPPQTEIIGGGKGWDASLALPPPPQVMGCKLAQPFWA